MVDSIDWKEAKGGRRLSDDEEGDNSNRSDEIFDNSDASQTADEVYNDGQVEDGLQTDSEADQVPTNHSVESDQRHQHFKDLNLQFRKNLTNFDSSRKLNPNQSVDTSWLENAIVNISPSGDTILFSSNTPEKSTFIAKLRMDPVDQYVIKPLEIPLDYDEQVTSVLCLPIMSTQKTSLGLVDWNAIVVGLTSGYTRFYTEQGTCLLSLKFQDEPVVSIRCHTQKSNPNGRSELHFATTVDELLITYKSAAFVADGLGLYENLRIANKDVIQNGSHYEPAYNLTNLPIILNCHKWKIDELTRGARVTGAESLGSRCNSKFDLLRSSSINIDHVPAKSYARALSFVGCNPFISYYLEAKDNSSHSYTEIIGSLFPFWGKPAVSRVQINELSPSSNISLYDKNRLATSITASPDKRLAAITDDFGRVMLLDVTNWIVIRIWKGYRSAQCGWSEVKRNPEERCSPCALFLIIYAPKRGLLEIWSAQRGPRVAAYNVGKSCRLLYSGYGMLNTRADLLVRSGHGNLIERSYSSNCYLLDASSQTVHRIDIPYTYSLYKYGDLKSKDHLLIGELMTAIQQDSDVEFLSDLLNRMTLADSLQNSIHKIASNLLPDKISPIMESLINNIMKNYDNESGELMTTDDESIIELCKRLIRLCALYLDLSGSGPNDIKLRDINSQLIDHYEEHPQEIDEFAEKLSWSTTEILRYLSLLALERSYKQDHQASPWPSLGEPLSWSEFVSCFSLARIDRRRTSSERKTKDLQDGNPTIRLREGSSKFLSEDRVIKTSLFMFNRLSEKFYRSTLTLSSDESINNVTDCYSYLDPSSRLALLFRFWLSTRLCSHWKLWAFLQNQVGQTSDELKVIAMGQGSDEVLSSAWKQIYNLILESDNIYAALVATATIRSDTIRTIDDDERRGKLDNQESEEQESQRRSSIDWECLCIDAERMSLLSQQLEDVFLLNMLLKYSPKDGHLVENFVYRVPRISVATILRGGPTIVSELVAQWACQSNVDVGVFVRPYGSQPLGDGCIVSSPPARGPRRRLYAAKLAHEDHEDHAMELLHHVKTSFPRSLDSDVILINCLWEFCRRYLTDASTSNRSHLLRRAYDCLRLLSDVGLRHKAACLAYKTFFQRPLERLTILVETNSALVSSKSSRSRDVLSRKELNMSEECLEDFVQFCCDLTDLMLQTNGELEEPEKCDILQPELEDRILALDDEWWTPHNRTTVEQSLRTDIQSNQRNSLAGTIVSASNLPTISVQVELNRLASLMNLIFKLKIIKAYPMSLIGEESRQTLKMDLQQLSAGGALIAEVRNRSSSLSDLRQKFARRCILNIVSKLCEETSDFAENDKLTFEPEDIDTNKCKFGVDKWRDNKGKPTSMSEKLLNDAAKDSDRKAKAGSRLQPNDINIVDDDEDEDEDNLETEARDENNESMVQFANLLSLASEWKLDCDELYLELAFELYRNNHDKIASQISTRIRDQQTLAGGLLKICSQRVLVLFGLSPGVSSSAHWRQATDKWPMFPPNVASWLRGIQQEEIRREVASLSFSVDSKLQREDGNIFGLQTFVLGPLRERTKLLLETATNHLDGQASRLAYDLLQLLESSVLSNFLASGSNEEESGD